MSTLQAVAPVAADDLTFHEVIRDICSLNWAQTTDDDFVAAAWAYYYFSIQFRENLQVACRLYPDDTKLQQLHKEECATANLSPWPGVAQVDEAMDHDEFMRRLLALSPIDDATRTHFQTVGEKYLKDVRASDDQTRALSIASYEDGGLENVFRAMLQAPVSTNPLIAAFRHFLSEHIRFDSDPDGGHGSLSRHMRPDDRILPLWIGFRRLYEECVPGLTAAT
jgi:hypothetical protein